MPGGLGILGCNLRFRVRPSSETARCGALHAHGQAVEQSTRTRRTSPRRTPHRPYLPAAQSHELAHLREAGRIRADTIRSACLKNHPCHDGVPDARVHGRRLESEHNGAGREGERELESGACNSRSLTPAPSPSPRHVATMFLLCLALHPAAPFTRFTHLRARPPFASQLSVSGADSPQTGTFHDVRPCPQRCDRRNPGFEASATTGLDQEIGADEAVIANWIGYQYRILTTTHRHLLPRHTLAVTPWRAENVYLQRSAQSPGGAEFYLDPVRAHLAPHV